MPIKPLPLFLLLWLIAGSPYAQTPPGGCELTTRYVSQDRYIDDALCHDTLFGLTKGRLVRAFSATTGDWLGRVDTLDKQVFMLCQDANHGLYACTPTKLWRRQADGHWQVWREFPGDTLLGMAFNSANALFLITRRGVMDAATGKKYFHPYVHALVKRTMGWFERPSVWLDLRDQLWISFDFGEWGGDLFLFDTHWREFVWDNVTCMGGITGMADAGEVCYVSSSSAHMMSFGTLYEIRQGYAELLFSSEEEEKKEFEKIEKQLVINRGSKTVEELKAALEEAQARIKRYEDLLHNGEYVADLAWSATEQLLYVNTSQGLFTLRPGDDFADRSQRGVVWQQQDCGIGGITAFTLTGAGKGVLRNKEGALGIFQGNRILLIR